MATCRHTYRHQALTLPEVIVIIILCLLLLALFVGNPLKFLATGNPPPKRLVCASNLRCIVNAAIIYSESNRGFLPVVPHAATNESAGVGTTTYVGELNGKPSIPRSEPTQPGSRNVSTTRGLWLLIRYKFVKSKQFICPSTTDSPNTDQRPEQYYDFNSLNEVSYGTHVTFGNGRPFRNSEDPRMVFAADKGPYSSVERGKPAPDISTTSLISKRSTTTRYETIPQATLDKWKPYNSPNHKNEGMNMARLDESCSFKFLPIEGVDGDNIYTRWSATPQSPLKDDEMIRGVSPSLERPNLVPMSNTDSLIYP